MFGNQYQQAVVDEQNLRRQQAQTGGLTGWAAITNAMSGIGSEIGYQGGQAMGGMTPAQAQQSQFQSVIDSVPNYDPMNPESVQQMSSALWQGGFYNEAMSALNQSKAMQVDDAKIALYEAQARDEDTVDGPSPTEIIATTKAERNALATNLVSSMPVTTSAEIQSVANVLRSGGYADTAQYKDLMRNLTTRLSYESAEEKETQTNVEQAEKVETADITLKYKPVMEVGKGVALVNGFFLDNAPAGLGNDDTKALASSIGGLIETYDNTLSTDRGEVSPGEAVAFYERALSLPEVYEANQANFQGGNPLDWIKGSKFSSEAFRNTLDKSFSRNGQSVSSQDLYKFAKAGLIIPGITVIDMGGGNVGTITAEGLAEYLANDSAAIPGG